MNAFVWKQVLQNWVLPPGGPLVLAAVGLALALFARARWRSAGLSLCAAAIGVLWVLATPRVADHLVWWAQMGQPLDPAKPRSAQALVILGGGARAVAPEYGSVAPSATTLDRLVYGAWLARATALPVLVTGSHSEAAAMSDFLKRDLGVTPTWIENRSADTYDNARRSWAILAPAGVRNIVLVTSAIHMPRARAEFENVGFTVTPAPTSIWTARDAGFAPWVPSADALARSQRVLHEYLGQLVRWAR